MAKLRNKNATRWDLDKIFEEFGYPRPFPGKITFADVDFEIEINGHFLVLEGKRDGQVLETGQEIAMNARYDDGRTCAAFWGDPDTGEVSAIQIWPTEKQPADRKVLWDLCNQWGQWAKTQSRPEPKHSAFSFTPRELPRLEERLK